MEGLDRLTKLNGTTFAELPTVLRLAFGKRGIRVTALSDKSDYKVRFDMFERLNRGALRLTEQEVRAVIYRGEFNALLLELAAEPSFRELVKLQPKRDDDGTREELALKFFAYLHNREHFDGLVTDFLNKYMEQASESFDVEEGRKLFRAVSKKLLALCGGPFLRPNYGNTPLNQLEAVMVAAGELAAAGKLGGASPKDGWLSDMTLRRYSTKGTNTVNALRRRIERASELLKGADVKLGTDGSNA